ncbi:MAG: hypothetical protein HY066_04280 [Betaproteobacteria bacterium]|nr:hypothetical protein [Betaproteobacteria bacterium]
MKLAKNILSAVGLAALLTQLPACGSSDAASYVISTPSHSLSLLREKQFVWDSAWDVSLVTSNNPECMRRHKLQPAPDGEFKAELYRSLEGNYILKQGNNWYVTETRKCRLQQFKEPPREPGNLLGSFEIKDDMLQFVPAANPPATTAPAG